MKLFNSLILIFSMISVKGDMSGDIDVAMKKCGNYMNAVLTCWPPKRKIAKYWIQMIHFFRKYFFTIKLGNFEFAEAFKLKKILRNLHDLLFILKYWLTVKNRKHYNQIDSLSL